MVVWQRVINMLLVLCDRLAACHIYYFLLCGGVEECHTYFCVLCGGVTTCHSYGFCILLLCGSMS